jgi:hypothetical protein
MCGVFCDQRFERLGSKFEPFLPNFSKREIVQIVSLISPDARHGPQNQAGEQTSDHRHWGSLHDSIPFHQIRNFLSNMVGARS